MPVLVFFEGAGIQKQCSWLHMQAFSLLRRNVAHARR